MKALKKMNADVLSIKLESHVASGILALSMLFGPYATVMAGVICKNRECQKPSIVIGIC